LGVLASRKRLAKVLKWVEKEIFKVLFVGEFRLRDFYIVYIALEAYLIGKFAIFSVVIILI
jgi:hypothetical protein